MSTTTEDSAPPPQSHKRLLHSKRSFGKYPRTVSSPAYDASEEDNETDDGASTVQVPVRPPGKLNSGVSSKGPTSVNRVRHQLASSVLSDSDGVDSPTYDGDVESSATVGQDREQRGHHHHASSTSTLNSSVIVTPHAEHRDPPMFRKSEANHPVFISQPAGTTSPQEPDVPQLIKEEFNPAALTPEDIKQFVQTAIDGETWRKYKINTPPTDRPIRVYADGVYDLFHFGHALQLRQAKLSFPSVYLLVGVCSDELVLEHKARSIMSHAERLEAARHCRWVDEVVPEAPWIIDQAFLDRWEIDYVAHDEDPYVADGHEDVYALVKSQGKFIPTRRTPGVSTSELLERIVSGYRRRDFDTKLVKMGHAELCAEGSDYDDMSSRGASRSISPM